MRITRVVSTLVVFGLTVFGWMSPLAAQVPGAPKAPSIGITVGLKASTLGFGPEVGYLIGPHLGVRAGFQGASVSPSLTSGGNTYSAKVKWASFDALLDVYLIGPLRVSGGYIHNGNKIDVAFTQTATAPVTTPATSSSTSST